MKRPAALWRVGAAAMLLLVSGPSTAVWPAAPVGTAAPDALATLFEAARTPGRVAGLDLKPFVALERAPAQADAAALWPLQAFLLAEAHGLRGDSARALAIHREVVEWAATDPYRDGSGGSALAALSLWRLLSAPGRDPAADAALFDLAWRYWSNHGALAQALFDAPPVLGALPQLREALLRRMAVLGWAIGRRSTAHKLLAGYLAIARDDELEPALQRILDDAVEQGAIAHHKVLLELGKRLDRLGKAEPARRLFVKARAAPDPDVAADARLQLAQAMRRTDGRPCATTQLQAEIDEILAAAHDAGLQQRALLLRARRYLQAGCPTDAAAFERDLARLQREFPFARATFDALLVAAEFHLDRHLGSDDPAALDQALVRYDQARRLATAPGAAIEGFMRAPSRRTLELVGPAWFKPALWLHARARPGDLRQALALLDDLLARWPDGPLRLAAGFWRGRLLAEAGSSELARAQFEALIADSPYDYHALRARMRLRLGDEARLGLDLDRGSHEAIAQAGARGRSGPRAALRGDSEPALRRLRATLANGVYRAALSSYLSLRRDRLPGHAIEDITLEELEQSGRWVDVALALALRRDAAAVAGTPSAAGQRLDVAQLVSGWATADGEEGDWPLAVALSGGRASLQHEPGYLATAFPRAYTTQIVREAARASLLPELLYAVMRTETAFDPVAQSSRAALGLFQFMPATFRMLNERWHLVTRADAAAAEAFLLNADTNIALGARWFSEELLPREGGNVLFALMAHNAGPASVRRWKEAWTRVARIGDTEFIVDTVPFEETRGFARRALTAMWIATATGAARAASAPSR